MGAVWDSVSFHLDTLPNPAPCINPCSIHDADDDDDEEEGAGSRQALRRGQYPVFFGKQDPAMLKRVEEAQ